MKQHEFPSALLGKPRLDWVKDELTSDARPVAVLTFRAEGVPVEVVQELARHALNELPVKVTVQLTQMELPMATPAAAGRGIDNGG